MISDGDAREEAPASAAMPMAAMAADFGFRSRGHGPLGAAGRAGRRRSPRRRAVSRRAPRRAPRRHISEMSRFRRTTPF